jgi:putative colanic acid biosynthesis acetyltransferase WcaF
MMLQSKMKDPYKNSAFTFTNKLKRLFWQVTWAIFCRFSPAPLHFWRIFFVRLFGGHIGHHNAIYPSCKIWAPWLLEMEDYATIGPNVEIYNPGGVFIGDHAIVSQNAYICGATHNYNSKDFDYIKKKITLERYVWICARAIVLPGVTCHEGSVLAAGSTTSKDLLAWTVYAGNPGMPVKKRNEILPDLTNTKSN